MGESPLSREDELMERGLEPGVRLRLEVTVGDTIEVCDTSITTLSGDAVVVELPVLRFEDWSPPEGADAVATYAHEGKTWWFESTVLAPRRDGRHRLARPRRIAGGERRATFRLPYSAKADLVFRVTPPGVIEPTRSVISCNVLDVSEGGVRLSTPAPVEVGDWLGIELTLGLETLGAKLAVQTVSVPHPPMTRYRLGCRFGQISVADRDAIRRFVMLRQARMTPTVSS